MNITSCHATFDILLLIFPQISLHKFTQQTDNQIWQSGNENHNLAGILKIDNICLLVAL